MNEEKTTISEEMSRELYEEAADKIDELFGDGAEDNGFEGQADQKTQFLMKMVIGEICDGRVISASIRINERITAKISLGTKGIKVERRETKGAAL